MSVKTYKSMINWIEENITDNPTLGAMSGYVGYSPFYCSVKFREYFGMTFKEYVTGRRLSLAAAEITETDSKLLEIAVKYGYSSQEAFTRAFIRNFGCTPFQCRKNGVIPQPYVGHE